MKKLLIVSLALASLGLSASALAQAAGPAGGAPPVSPLGGKHGGHAGHKGGKMLSDETMAQLNLTEDQKTKIKAKQEETKAKLQELKKGNKGAKGAGVPEDVKEKMKAIRKEYAEFIKQTLTKDQKKQLLRMRAEERKQAAGTKPTP